MCDLPVWRLYLMRAMYALMAFGLAVQVWPTVISPEAGTGLQRSVVLSVLATISLLSLLGIRYPVKMIPLLLFEWLWKVIWVLAFWYRLWHGGPASEAVNETFFACMMGVVLVPIVLPWGYVFRNYFSECGDRWRSVRSTT